MTKYVIFANTDDGYIDSNSTVYSTARAGTGTKATTNGTTNLLVGQSKVGSTYHVYQGFIRFDTTVIPSTDVLAYAAILLKFQSVAGAWDPANNGFHAKPYNGWSPPVDNTDYLAGATASALFDGGYANTTPGVGTQFHIPLDIGTTNTVINIIADSRFILNTGDTLNNVAPTGNDYTSVYSAESGTNSPVLVVYTLAVSGALPSGRAAHQLSTGQTVEVKGGPSKSSWTGDLVYYDKFATTAHTILANIGQYFTPAETNGWLSPEAVDIAIDQYNTIYVVGPGSNGSQPVTNVVMIRNTGGLTWAAPVLVQIPSDTTGNRIVTRIDLIRQYFGVLLPPGMPANVDYQVFIGVYTITEQINSSSTVQSRSRFQWVDPSLIWSSPLPDTLTELDITSPTWIPADQFVGQPKAEIVGIGRNRYAWALSSPIFAVATQYESGNGGSVKTNIAVLKVKYSQNTGYSLLQINAESATISGLSLVQAADAKIKMVPTSSTQACLICGMGGGNPYAITIDSNGNMVTYAPSNLTSIPDSLLTGQWDAFYDPVSNSVWLYYLDTSTAGRVSKVAFKLATGVWDDANSVVVSNSAPATGVNTWLKLAKRTLDERTVHIMIENNNGGTLSHTILTDSFNKIPNAPVITVPNTYDATLPAVISWVPSDPNSQDTQLKYEIEIDNNATSATEWHPGAITSAANSATIPANQLTQNIVHRARIRTYDEQNNAGNWSAYSTFSTSDIGSVTIDVPVDDLQTGANSSLQLTLSYHTSGLNTISKYRVKTIRVLDSVVLQDTGEVAASGLSVSPTISNLPSDTPLRFDVYIVNSAAQTTPTVSRKWTTSFLAPDQITNIFATVNGMQIDLAWAVPVPTGSRPAPDTIAIYRSTDDGSFELIARVYGTATSFTDYIPKSGSTPVYYVVGETITGNTQSTTATGGLFQFYGMVLNQSNNDPTNPWSPPIPLYFGGAGTGEHRSDNSTVLQFQGRAKPVTEFGQNTDHTVTAKATIPFLGNPINGLDDSNQTDMNAILQDLRDLTDSHDMVCFRDGRGRKVFGNFKSFDETDSAIGSEVTISMTDSDYAESSF